MNRIVRQPRPPQYLQLFIDGQPEDCLLPPGRPDRLHTMAWIHGTEQQHEQIAEEIRKNVPHFQFQKWCMKGLGRSTSDRNRQRDYRDVIRTHLLPAMLAAGAPGQGWTFSESTVWAVKSKLMEANKVKHYDVLVEIDKKGRRRWRFKKFMRDVPSIVETEALMVMMMADCIATAEEQYRQATADLDRPTTIWETVTDFIAGDDRTRQPLGNLLQCILNTRRPGIFQCAFRNVATLPISLLIADNLCGLLNSTAQDMACEDAVAFRDLIERHPGSLIWNETNDQFQACPMCPPQTSAPDQVAGRAEENDGLSAPGAVAR